MTVYVRVRGEVLGLNTLTTPVCVYTLNVLFLTFSERGNSLRYERMNVCFLVLACWQKKCAPRSQRTKRMVGAILVRLWDYIRAATCRGENCASTLTNILLNSQVVGS